MRITMEDPIRETEQEQQDDRPEQQEERQQKTFRQKVEYFWDYHKWKVIVPVIIMVFAVSIITSYLQETKDLTLYVAVMNAHMDSPEDADFGERYATDRHIDTQELPIRMETNLYHPKPDTGEMNETSIASIQKYQALLTNGNVDVTITTDWVIEEYEKSGCYLNLQEVLPPEMYGDLSGQIYYAKNQDGDMIPVGIYVDQTETMKKFYEKDKPIITISAFSERTDAAIDFIQWLLVN